jgi:Tannase and feruloyl esterase
MLSDMSIPKFMLVTAVLVTAVVGGATGALAPRPSGVSPRLTAAMAPESAAQAGQAHAAATVRPVIACDKLASGGYDFSNVPGAPAIVATAATATDDGISFCNVTGYIAPQEQFELSLPVSTYAGRYVQDGCGGTCGTRLASADPGCPGVSDDPGQDEFVFGHDDQGHVQGGEYDDLWAKEDPALRVSFGYSSEHAMAQAAKAIIAAYYGKPPAYSYFQGCSDGGHEALVEAQRYPRDFNGILAGAPGSIEAQLLAVVPAWLISVNTEPDGHEILTSGKLPALHAAVVQACAGASGLIEDPRSCDFDPATIQCPAGTDSPACLTPAQVTVVRKYYLGPSDGHGHYLYPGGEPYGSELGWATRLIEPASDTRWPEDTQTYQVGINYLRYAAYWSNPLGSFQLKDFRFTVAAYSQLLPLAGIYDATDPDLSAFQQAGGKLIMWQGWADPSISPFGTVDYYKAVVQQAGGFAASQAFTRLYMIPDQYHCTEGGSPQVNAQTAGNDLFEALIRWTEQGAAPSAMSFPLAQPTATLAAITVHPLNPLSPPPGGSRGLNTQYHWVGEFRSGAALWCTPEGTNLACGHHKPPISYALH